MLRATRAILFQRDGGNIAWNHSTGGHLQPFCRGCSVEVAAAQLPHTMQFLHPTGKFTLRGKGPCHCRRRQPQRALPNVNVRPSGREGSVPTRKITWKIYNGTEETRITRTGAAHHARHPIPKGRW
jgi:hypothetical protein